MQMLTDTYTHIHAYTCKQSRKNIPLSHTCGFRHKHAHINRDTTNTLQRNT